MSDPFIGEIRIMAGHILPRGWAYCDGQFLNTDSNDALYSLLGTQYGGDGVTTFKLPDLRGRVPMHYGSGYGLSYRSLAEAGGAENVAVKINEMPHHTHPFQASENDGVLSSLEDATVGQATYQLYQAESAPNAAMSPSSISSAGGRDAHSNMMPFLCTYFIICLVGTYPTRS